MKAAERQGSVIFLKGCNYYVAFYRTKDLLLLLVFLIYSKTGWVFRGSNLASQFVNEKNNDSINIKNVPIVVLIFVFAAKW